MTMPKYSEAARTYRENNRYEINARQRNARRRNVELSTLNIENEYLRETLSNDVPPLSICTRINCCALSFSAKHGRTKRNCCHQEVKLANINYVEGLKYLLLVNRLMLLAFIKIFNLTITSFAMVAFCQY